MTTTRWGYLGPEGTFTHQALRELAGPQADALIAVPLPTVGAALDAVRSGSVDASLVPIENSVEGGVSATLDQLAAGERLQITAEVVLAVRFALMVRPGTAMGDVRAVITHPHAWAQCRDWVARELPLASVTEGGSTAAGAAEVAAGGRHDAAICAPLAGEMRGLVAAASDIADNREARTRFVLVQRPVPPPPPSGNDRTTLVFFMHDDHPGALLELLEQTASRGVNLSRLESRPTKTSLGSYCFSVDLDGHLAQARVAEAIMGLRRVGKDVIFLGSYPKADGGTAPAVAPSISDESYERAQVWLEALRRGE